jgi:hypothetical protein
MTRTPEPTSSTGNASVFTPTTPTQRKQHSMAGSYSSAQGHSSNIQQQQHLHQRRRGRHAQPDRTKPKDDTDASPPNDVELNTSDEYISTEDDDEDDEDDEDDDDDDDDDDGTQDALTGINSKLLTSSSKAIPVSPHQHIRMGGSDDTEVLGDRLEQHLLLEEEDVQVIIYGYRYHTLRYMIYRLCCISTLGIVWLIARWVPTWWIKWVGQQVPLKDAQWLVFKVSEQTFSSLFDTFFLIGACLERLAHFFFSNIEPIQSL